MSTIESLPSLELFSEEPPLPSEIRYIIYGFLDSRRVTQLSAMISPNENELFACQIQDSRERARRLEEIGNMQLQRSPEAALAIADRIHVPYRRIHLLCAIGKELASQGRDDEAKALFNQAKNEAAKMQSVAQRVYSFVHIGKVEQESNDPLGAAVSFKNARDAAEQEENRFIKAQHMRLIEREQQAALA